MKYKFWNILKNRKTLYLVFGTVLISVFSLTIVYAALNTILKINGNAEVVASSWDIRLENVNVTGGSVGNTVPTITGFTTTSFTVTLNAPGDFYEFTVDAVNKGSIDAMIDSVEKTPTLTTEQAKYINYIIEYQNGDTITTKQALAAGSFVRLKVRVEFRKDVVASDLPSTSETLNLAFTVNYVQSDGSASNVTDNGVYDPYKIGNEICFDTECFYVISSAEETVTMLSKYNLYVGGVYNNGWTAYGDEATGKQDLNMIGYKSGQTIRKGTIQFSNTNYWSSTVSSYPSYIYDSNSILYSYVENYKTYLSTLGVTPSETRLITYEELIALGCSKDDWSCLSAPSWVYSTSYWLGSAFSFSNVWRVNTDGYFGGYNYSDGNVFGCRPVIVIDRDLL